MGDAGASLTTPIRAGEVKKGMIVMLKDKPCKVIEITTSKTGKHGHAKANITGLDIFTGAKKQDICPTSHNMTAPVVGSMDWSLLGISDDGFLSLMTDEGETRDDLKIPDYPAEIADQIQAGLELVEEGGECTVRVTTAMNNAQVSNVTLKSG